MITQQYLTDLTYKINGACIEVHKILGAGLAEVVLSQSFRRRIQIKNLNFKSEFSNSCFFIKKRN